MSVLSLDKHGNIVTCCRARDLTHHSLWSSSVQVQESLPVGEGTESGTQSQLHSLNLSHNNFTAIPQGLACLALNLNRLYLAYNRLGNQFCFFFIVNLINKYINPRFKGNGELSCGEVNVITVAVQEIAAIDFGCVYSRFLKG